MFGLPFVNGVNSTSLKVVTGCALAVIVNVFYCLVQAYLMIAHSTPLEPVTFGEILTFDAAFAGIAYAQFKTKRETEKIIPPETTTQAETIRAEQGVPAAGDAKLTPAQMRQAIAEGEARNKAALEARLPKAGQPSSDPAIREGMQTIADRQNESVADDGAVG